MKKLNLFLVTLMAFSFVTACQPSSPHRVDIIDSSTAAAPDAQVTVSMVRLKYELDQILPYLVSPKQFHNPQNQKTIEQRLLTLSQIGQTVSHVPSIMGTDPILEFLSIGFEDELKRSFDSYKNGHMEYSRLSLLNVTAYCIECHTRTQSGPSFATDKIDSTWKSLRLIDQIDYLVATRQFDLALKTINSILSQGLSDKINVFDLDRAVRLGLMISVRFNQNPEQTIQLITALSKAPNIPFYLKAASQSWLIKAKSWSRQANLKIYKEPFDAAKELFEQTQAPSNKGQFNEIEMFRIQALLNPIIASEKNNDRLGEELFLLGTSYEQTKDIAIWSLHEGYYETCIKRLPASKWAAKCYEALEKSLYLGYTGSRGTFLPEEVQIKLNELKKIANPNSVK